MRTEIREKRASTYDPADAKLAQAVTKAALGLIVGASKPGEASDTIEPDVAIDGLLMALALVIEQAPQCTSFRTLERHAEIYGKQIAAYARQARASYDRSGVHPIDSLLHRFGTGETVN